MDTSRFLKLKHRLIENVSKVIVGKEQELELIIVAFLAGGHVLLEDIPGVGKTMMIKAFSKSLDLPFKRIQFTPDLLPSDITGINYYNQKTGEFQFREGPLFANIVLADEINRATPRTQASLLEAMEEKQITADGLTRKLSLPFMVLATQNPVESFGTFPLPEAQLDRFFMRIKLGYPLREEEKTIIERNAGNLLDGIEPAISGEELGFLLSTPKQVTIHPEVMEYLVEIVDRTRNDKDIELGVSPRGSIALYKGAQAYAAIKGRDYILPEDIKALAPHVLNHRIITRGSNTMAHSVGIVEGIVDGVTVPLEDVV